jgi:hypothetical protein
MISEMRSFRTVLLVVVGVGAGLLLFAWCARDSADAPDTGGRGLPPAAVQTQAQRSAGNPVTLDEVQAAVSSYPGFTLEMQGHNLVLPQWGGISGPSRFEVNMLEHMVRGTITRTGEPDAAYEIRYVAREAFFKRSTCSEWFRLPGAGAGLFQGVFDLWHTGIPDAPLERVRSEGTVDFFEGVLAGFGEVELAVDRGTGLPGVVRSDDDKRSDGAVFDVYFRGWGEVPQVEPPSGSIADRGPGGVPC